MDERRFNACGEVDRIDDTLQKWLCATRFVDCKNWFKRLLTTADSNIKILSRTKKIVLNYSHSHVDDESDVANINISYHKFNRKITNPSYSTFDICFASGVVSTLNIITGFLNHFICFSVRVSDRKCPPIGCFVGYVWTKIFTHVRKFLLPAKNISDQVGEKKGESRRVPDFSSSWFLRWSANTPDIWNWLNFFHCRSAQGSMIDGHSI